MFGISVLAATLLSDPTLAGDLRTASAAATLDEPVRRDFNTSRAVLEIGGALALGTVWYQSQIELNKLDFDFARSWSDQWRRVSGAGYRFDDNNLTLNVGHSMVGAYYHQFARANGGGMLEAVAFDFVTSTSWELLVEHREVVSVNDTVMTGAGGISIGEGLYQLGDYFGRSRPTVLNRLLMGLFSPAHAFSWLTGDAPTPSRAGWDRHGLAADAEHRFQLALGGAQVRAADGTRAWQGDLRVDLELVNLPEYGHTGTRHRILRGGEFTRMTFDTVGTRDQQSHTAFSARTSMWGVHDQKTTAGPLGGLEGSAVFLGTSSAFELASDAVGTGSDFLCAVHLLGPAADATFYRDQWRFRLAADVTPDFALVRPYALAVDAAGTPHGQMKSTVQTFNYYYALGVAGAGRLEAAFRKARAGVDVAYGYYDSVEGLDRHQQTYTSPTGVYHEGIHDDGNIVDQRLAVRLFSEAAIPMTDVRLGVSLDYQHRSGQLSGSGTSGDNLRWGVHAAYGL
jgi:hypothetical protein